MDRSVSLRCEDARILVLVKSYPRPSRTYGETDCIAGLLDGKQWVRLYPVMFRGLSSDQTFDKWQWITTRLSKSHKDPRPESWEPDHHHIQLGTKIGTDPLGWGERMKYLDNISHDTIESLRKDVRRSLGWVQPQHIGRFYWKPDSDQWPSHLQIEQMRFLGSPSLPIEKIPYKFFAQFHCTEACSHDMSIIDWEIYELYRKTRDPDKVVQKLNDMQRSRALSFFVGTSLRNHKFGAYMIIGLFYPPPVVASKFL